MSSVEAPDESQSSSSSCELDLLNNPVKSIDDTKYHYVPAFESIKLSSFLAVARLDGNINLDKTAALLPIDLNNTQGAINSIKYGPDIRRGLIKTEGVMQNMLMIGITIPDPTENYRVFNVNIGPSSFHICGLKESNPINNIIAYMLSKLFELQNELAKYDLATHRRVIEFLVSKTRGNLIIETVTDEGSGTQQTKSWVELLQPPILNNSSEIPLDLYQIYQRPLSYVTTWNKYLFTLQQCLSTNYIFVGDLKIVKVDKTNFLYNYALGCNIDRANLTLLLNNYKNFRATFVNQVRSSLKVTLPCKDWNSPFAMKKGKQEPPHSFSISAKGKVTQNSPCEEESSYAYYQLMAALIELGVHTNNFIAP